MSLYRDRVLPHLVDFAMKQETFVPYRRRVAGLASGRVLEIGVGSGLNLPLYRADVHIVGLEPSARLIAMAHDVARNLAPRVHPIELIEGSAEDIPLPDESVDTVVTTWTLCSIPNLPRALAEMRRVIRPGGQLLFAEHGHAPDPRVARWQDRLTPVWRRIAGGCHLNRRIDEAIASAGFRVESLETGYMTGPRPMTFMYEGMARPRP